MSEYLQLSPIQLVQCNQICILAALSVLLRNLHASKETNEMLELISQTTKTTADSLKKNG